MEHAWPATTMLVERIRADYLEMPGLRLTPLEASRFWGLDPARCEYLLRQLLASGFLARTSNGAYYVAGRG